MHTPRNLWMAANGLLLVGLAGTIAILIALHHFGWINIWRLPLKAVSIVLISIGLLCGGLAHITRMRSHPSPGHLNRSKPPSGRKRWQRQLGGGVIVLLLLLNGFTYLLAYYKTHVREAGQPGIGFPKPQSPYTPIDRGLSFTTYRIPAGQADWLEAWHIPVQGRSPQGSVLLFPGNLGTKGHLLAVAQSFNQLGYETLLIDFRGVGGSSGHTITIGIREAEDVVTAFKDAQELNLPSPLVLYGVSMGSAAILRAIANYDIKPDAVILELPFARLLNAVRSRLAYHRIPPWMTAELIVFWAGVQHQVNGFSHNPIDFARAVDCPALVIHGAQDKWITVAEVEALVQNLHGSKQLVISPDAGHQQLIGVNRNQWNTVVKQFFNSL